MLYVHFFVGACRVFNGQGSRRGIEAQGAGAIASLPESGHDDRQGQVARSVQSSKISADNGSPGPSAELIYQCSEGRLVQGPESGGI